MLEVRKVSQVLAASHARLSPDLKGRKRNRDRVKRALKTLVDAFDTGFRHDLLESTDQDIGRRFLDLLPLVKRSVDEMTDCHIRERWLGNDGRRMRVSLSAVEIDFVRHYVRMAGLATDPPNSEAREVMRRMLGFIRRKEIGSSAIRKRLKVENTRQK
jgi:hypothetical protein